MIIDALSPFTLDQKLFRLNAASLFTLAFFSCEQDVEGVGRFDLRNIVRNIDSG